MDEKFIVLSRPRTGSTLLVKIMNKLDGVYCADEIFNNINVTTEKSSEPIKFLKRFFNTALNKKISIKGFKLHYDHAQTGKLKQIWAYLGEKKYIRIIQLKRRNLLRVVASFEKAMLTQSWATFSEHDACKKNIKVTLSHEKCLRNFLNITEDEKKYHDLFKSHNIIVIYYEDLYADYDKVIYNIQDLLNIPRKKIDNICKVRTVKLHDEITNYWELKEKFINTEWENFFED